MPLVKIIRISHHWNEYDDDARRTLIDGITDWTEVDNITYDKLRNWARQRNNNSYKTNETVLVAAQLEEDTVPTSIADYIQLMKDEEEEEERKEASKKKRAATRRRKLEEREKKKFAELKIKFEGTNETNDL